MANLNVRIYNKFDTYENWMKSTLVLGAGEIAIASIPSGDNTGLTPPAIGVKVGDGSKTFSQLSWIQATAGDVYSWAKAATKPEYAASEITGLADFISGEIQDSNTEYSFSLAENYKLKIQKKDIGGEYADYQTIDLTSAFAAKADKVTGATAGNFAGLDSNGNLLTWRPLLRALWLTPLCRRLTSPLAPRMVRLLSRALILLSRVWVLLLSLSLAPMLLPVIIMIPLTLLRLLPRLTFLMRTSM